MKKNMNTRNRRYWKIFGLITLGLIIYMCYPFVDVILYSVFIYYISRPVYKRFYKRIKSSNASAFISLFITILPVLLILIYTAAVATFELNNVLSGINYSIPAEYDPNRVIVDLSEAGKGLTPKELWDMINESGITAILDTVTKNLPNIQKVMGDMGVIALKLFLVFTIGFYMLKDGGKLRNWFTKMAFGGDPELCERFISEVDKDLHRVFFGNVLVAALTFLIAMVLFYMLNGIAPGPLKIPHPFLLSLLCGISIFIPAVGIKIVWVPMWIYLGIQAYLSNLLLSGLWFLLLFAVTVFLFVDLAPDLILRPHISSKKINPGVMLLSYIFGVMVFGFMGLFLGPIIVVLAANFMGIVLPEIRN